MFRGNTSVVENVHLVASFCRAKNLIMKHVKFQTYYRRNYCAQKSLEKYIFIL